MYGWYHDRIGYELFERICLYATCKLRAWSPLPTWHNCAKFQIQSRITNKWLGISTQGEWIHLKTTLNWLYAKFEHDYMKTFGNMHENVVVALVTRTCRHIFHPKCNLKSYVCGIVLQNCNWYRIIKQLVSYYLTNFHSGNALFKNSTDIFLRNGMRPTWRDPRDITAGAIHRSLNVMCEVLMTKNLFFY